jgi:hypothetical protein
MSVPIWRDPKDMVVFAILHRVDRFPANRHTCGQQTQHNFVKLAVHEAGVSRLIREAELKDNPYSLAASASAAKYEQGLAV